MLDIDFGTFPFVTSSHNFCRRLHWLWRLHSADLACAGCYRKHIVIRWRSFSHWTQDANRWRVAWRLAVSLVPAVAHAVAFDEPCCIKYTCMINGVTKVVMTKSRCVGCIWNIERCTAYNVMALKKMAPFRLMKLIMTLFIKVSLEWNTDSSIIRNQQIYFNQRLVISLT